jgi:hypothetical protein
MMNYCPWKVCRLEKLLTTSIIFEISWINYNTEMVLTFFGKFETIAILFTTIKKSLSMTEKCTFI